MKSLTTYILEAEGNPFNQELKTFDDFESLFNSETTFREYIKNNMPSEVVNGKLKRNSLVEELYEIHARERAYQLAPFVTTPNSNAIKIRRWIKDGYLSYFNKFECTVSVKGIKFPGGKIIPFGNGDGKAGSNTATQELITTDIFTKIIQTGKKISEGEVKSICDARGFDDTSNWLPTFNSQQDTFLKLLALVGLVGSQKNHVVMRYGSPGNGNELITNIIKEYARLSKKKKDGVQPGDIVMFDKMAIGDLNNWFLDVKNIKDPELKKSAIKSHMLELFIDGSVVCISMKMMDSAGSELKVRGAGEKQISKIEIVDVDGDFRGIVGLADLDFKRDIIDNKKTGQLTSIITKAMPGRISINSNVKTDLLVHQGDGKVVSGVLSFRNKQTGDWPSPTMDFKRKGAGAIDGAVDLDIIKKLLDDAGFPLFDVKYKIGSKLLTTGEISDIKRSVKILNNSSIIKRWSIDTISDREFEDSINKIIEQDVKYPLESVHRFLSQWINAVRFLCALEYYTKRGVEVESIYNTLVGSCVGDTEYHLAHIIIA